MCAMIPIFYEKKYKLRSSSYQFVQSLILSTTGVWCIKDVETHIMQTLGN